MEYWKEFYPDTEEGHIRKKLEPLGEPVTVWFYLDTNLSGNLENRIPNSGILIFVNNTLINLYSKRQNTVESSSFGPELVELITATEIVEALRYKLRTFGVDL